MVKKYVTALSIILRWGHKVRPSWVFGDEVVAPAPNTDLVKYTFTKQGYVYGYYIYSGEANDFILEWVSGGKTKQFKIACGAKGTLYFTDLVPMNEGLPADANSTVRIYNVNAGSAGVAYRAGLFLSEVIE